MKKFLRILIVLFIFMFLMTPITFGADTIIVNLEWGAVTASDLAGYNVYRSETSGANYVKINSVLVDVTNYSDVITDGMEKTFYYVVTAVDLSKNESGFSNEAYTRVDNIAPDIVPNLSVKSVTVGNN